VYRDHTDWNTSKIISQLVAWDVRSLHILQHQGSTTKETPNIWAGNGKVGIGKVAFDGQKSSSPNVSET